MALDGTKFHEMWEARSRAGSSIGASNFGVAAGTAPPTFRAEVSQEPVVLQKSDLSLVNGHLLLGDLLKDDR
jgi:hypothetical protein